MSTVVEPQKTDESVPLAAPSPSTKKSSLSSVTVTKRSAHQLEKSKASNRKLPIKWMVGCVVGIAMVVGVIKAIPSSATTDMLVLHTVQTQDLEIKVTERGNLESQDNVAIVCKVDDVERDGIHGTPILWIIENGASVKAGELIVELDGTNHRNRMDEQILEVQEEQADFIQARVQYENQKNQNQTNLQQANLRVELANLALQQFEDENGGTFQIELQSANLELKEAEANQLIEKTTLAGIRQLYELGYRSSNELAQAKLKALRAERMRSTAISKKRELVEYVYKKTKLQLEGDVQSAIQAFKQVKLDNEAELEQAKARMESAEQQLNKEKEMMDRYQTQLNDCKIYAPQDGMIAYKTGDRRYHEEMREGAPVRPRQTIMTIPNLKKMQVRTSIHESVLDQVKKGLNATVRVDALPDSRYAAKVHSVAVLPDQGGWSGSDTKVYTTVVQITEDVEFLKPGMTAVVEIHVDHLTDVMAVPIQAISQEGSETYCYVKVGHNVEHRTIEVGASNEKFVEIVSGIQVHDQVVLNPSAITDADKNRESVGIGETSDSPSDEPIVTDH